ncbi:MAG: trypsin-like serine protease [Oscillospiraceae bacterium]|jgi:serine protease Do|nr:trypsin-like serine protease [Oscillospiraceae bacterium]
MNEFNDKNNSLANTNYSTSNTGSSYSSGSYYSGYDEEPKKKGSGNTKVIAAAMVCSIILSGAAGFGGGILASRFTESESVQDTPSSSISSSMAPSSPAEANTVNTTVSSGAMSIAEIAAATANSVVEITTESVVTGGGFWVQQYVASGAGSGVILSEDGYIATNNHVIENATSVTVRLHNGESYEAQIIGADSEKDVALIKIDATGLTPAKIGDSDALVVGEDTVAVGNPLGQLGGTVTNGIVSALDREITIDGQTMNLLQTNAAINPGNSGGGLFNEKGELVGLVVAKSAGSDLEGLGFAIPINDVMEVVEQLKEFGYVTGKPYLGISLVDINTVQRAMQYGVNQAGVYVMEVDRPECGLQAGDCITQINGFEVESSDDISDTIKAYSAGDTVEMTVIRNGETITVDALLGEKVPQSVQKSVTAQ